MSEIRKVRLVDASNKQVGNTNLCKELGLAEGVVFDVARVNPDGDAYVLAGCGPNTWLNAGRFEIVDPAPASARGPSLAGDAAASARGPSLAGDAAARKAAPMWEGLVGYFPNALAAVAHVSKVGNDQHNPGQPLNWAFTKSTDEKDCILRHLCEAGTFDTSGTEPVRHSAKVAWRALANLERELLESNAALKPGVNVTGRVSK